MTDPFVRRAQRGDTPTLRELERVARAGLLHVRGGRRWLDTHAEIAGGWSAAIEHCAVIVAAIRDGDAPDVVVGYLVADLVDDPTPVARIGHVFVHADARELGFGDALVAAAMEWGRSVGATLIEAETLPGDRDLKNLYERAGVTARLIVVSKPL